MSGQSVVNEPCMCGINPGGDCDKSCEVVQPSGMDDLFRVYHREWVLVYSSAALDGEGEEEAIGHFREKYEGRVREEDWQVLLLGAGMAAQLTLHLPVLKGEFKNDSAAHLFAELQGWDAEVVIRNSREEKSLINYGREKLPSDQQ